MDKSNTNYLLIHSRKVAAGMSRQCEVEVFAIAVGVVGNSGTGYINHDLEIVSEANMLQIPIQANILSSDSNYYRVHYTHWEAISNLVS